MLEGMRKKPTFLSPGDVLRGHQKLARQKKKAERGLRDVASMRCYRILPDGRRCNASVSESVFDSLVPLSSPRYCASHTPCQPGMPFPKAQRALNAQLKRDRLLHVFAENADRAQHMQRQHAGKKGYGSEGEANTAASGVFDRSGEFLHEYQCLFCGAWHLGH
jgi:hypothetical protein